jgi:hypothetical protein
MDDPTDEIRRLLQEMQRYIVMSSERTEEIMKIMRDRSMIEAHIAGLAAQVARLQDELKRNPPE